MGRKTKMTRITSPEKTALINKNNMRLKDEFLMYLKSVQRSSGTISGYDSDLLILFTYILDNFDNKDFQRLTKRDLINFQNWLVSNGNSSARIRRIKAAISSLSNYCENILSDDDPDFDGYRSIVKKVENPPLQPVREKTVWEDEELEELLSKLVDKQQYNKACCLALAMYSGRRKAELTRFRVDDFTDDRLVCDGALYKSSPIQTKGRAGGKYIPCYTLAKKFKPYLDLWMEERERCGIESEWLFPLPEDPNEHIGISMLNSWAETFSHIQQSDFYWHALRHYYATSLARAGIPDGVIQSIVGWDSADMVRVYKDIDADEEIGMYFKDGDISVPDKKGFGDI